MVKMLKIKYVVVLKRGAFKPDERFETEDKDIALITKKKYAQEILKTNLKYHSETTKDVRDEEVIYVTTVRPDIYVA